MSRVLSHLDRLLRRLLNITREDITSSIRSVLINHRTLSGLPGPETRGEIRGRIFLVSFDRAV